MKLLEEKKSQDTTTADKTKDLPVTVAANVKRLEQTVTAEDVNSKEKKTEERK